jgi:hypothetical protein
MANTYEAIATVEVGSGGAANIVPSATPKSIFLITRQVTTNLLQQMQLKKIMQHFQ